MRKEKLKITTYSVPFIITKTKDGEGNDINEITRDIVTDKWVFIETEDLEIDLEKENLQLKIKENVDKVRAYNYRQEQLVLNDTDVPDTIKFKIIQRNKD